MHVLVTGSSGTIGTRLTEILLAKGHGVIGIDWVANKWKPEIDAITLHIDLRDEKALRAHSSKLKTCDVIIHLAANARVYELVEHPDRARDNFLTLFNTLECARTLSITKFLFASSRESYGNIKPTSYPFDWLRAGTLKAKSFREDMVRIENCESPYTASKVGGEALVHAYHACYGIDFITFRFSNVYGMYDDSIRVVPLFIRLAAKNEPMTIYGKEKCLDFTYIDDTVAGIILALEKFESAKNDTYNLAYGEGTTILTLAETIKKLKNSSSEIIMGKPRTGEVICYIADIAKAKEKLGYHPKVSFDEGIRRAVEWYCTH